MRMGYRCMQKATPLPHDAKSVPNVLVNHDT